MALFDAPPLDRRHVSVGSLRDESDEREFWRKRTPQERLAALEFLRQVIYGYDPASSRLQRVLEVAPLS
jgi:hypothetical protein